MILADLPPLMKLGQSTYSMTTYVVNVHKVFRQSFGTRIQTMVPPIQLTLYIEDLGWHIPKLLYIFLPPIVYLLVDFLPSNY